MSKTCLCLMAKTIRRNLEILNKYRKFADIAELRVDCLNPDERFLIRSFPEQAGLPVILAIRRIIDGGKFDGGEGARISLFAHGLAFADADRRRNFAYLDIEEDLDVPSLEDAARTFGTRIIRSYHNMHGVAHDLPDRIRDMKRNADDIVKIAVMADSTASVLRIFRAGKECKGQEKILLCKGHYGVSSRILAERFGSFLCYANALSEPDVFSEAEAGQIDIRELSELYRFRGITSATKVYGVLGNPLKTTEYPRFFNTIFRLEDIDAVYAPFPANAIAPFMELAKELDVSGLSVADPYKKAVIPFLSEQSAEVRATGVCNTLHKGGKGWVGTNSGVRAFSDSIQDFMGTKNLKWKKVTLIGAGNRAKVAAEGLYRLGARVLVLNRTIQKAHTLAAPYKFSPFYLDSRGIEMMRKYRDIIIQTLAMENADSDLSDTLDMYEFCGREHVIDLMGHAENNTFLNRAAQAGCRTLTYYDMLNRQAQYQYSQFTDRELPRQHLAKIQLGRSKKGE